MSKHADTYFEATLSILNRIRESNRATLEKVGPIIGRSVAEGGVLHTFGSGHSEIISREIIGRAGGLAGVSGIFDPTGGFIENLPGYGTRLAERYDRIHGLRRGEVIIVISNSGKNCSPIEIALYAKDKGLTVVALTCLEMSRAIPSCHPGGRRLFEIADFVLDNGGVPGDALVGITGQIKAGATSTVCGAMLLNLLQLEAMDHLVGHGHALPVLRSQNLEGAMEQNLELAARYRGRLSRPL